MVVDMQPAFLKPHATYVIDNIRALLKAHPYDLYVEALFHAEPGSVWDQQQRWVCPRGPQTRTVDALRQVLDERGPIRVLKQTKSAFKGDRDLVAALGVRGVREVHVVGTETNDCVLATAYDAFDHGYLTYVIEECCQSASSDGAHRTALSILRIQNMTNNSCLEDTIELREH